MTIVYIIWKTQTIINAVNCTSQILAEVDTILFCLMILSGLSDSRGNVWRCHRRQLYVAEVTIPDSMVSCLTLINKILHCIITIIGNGIGF